MAEETKVLLDQKTGSKDETVEFVDRIVNEGDSRLFPLRRIAYEGLLWYLGEQNVRYDPSTKRFVGARRDAVDWMIYPTINLVIQPVKVALGQFLASDPEGIVVPAGPDEKSRQAAKAGDMIRKTLNWEQRMQGKFRRATLESVVCGDSYMVTSLASDLMKTVEAEVDVPVPAVMDIDGNAITAEMLTPETQLAHDEEGNPVPAQATKKVIKQIPMTDVQTEVWSMFELFQDFEATCHDDIGWWAGAKLKSLDWIGDQFGSSARTNVAAGKKDSGSSSYSFRLFDMFSRGLDGGLGAITGNAYDMQNSARIKVFVQKPCVKQPRGRVLITCGDIVLHKGDNPWYLTEDPQKLGLVKFGYDPIIGTPYDFGMTKQIIDLNRRLRGIHAFMIHHRRMMAAGQWLNPKGSGLRSDRLTGKPGLIIDFDARKTGGAKPERIPGVQMDASVIEEEANVRGLITEISIGEGGVLAGNQPFAGMPGVSLNLLQEKAAGAFTFAKQEHEEARSRTDSQRLTLVPLARRWTQKQKVRVVGRDGTVAVDYFDASDMTGASDVRYEIGTKRAGSQAAYQQTLIDMMGLGVIDPANPNHLMKFLDEMGAAQFMPEAGLDTRMAQWENHLIETGRAEEVRILPYQDHEVHRAQHIAATKTVEFLSFPPEIQQAQFDHILAHDEIFQEIENRAAEDAVGPDDPNAVPDSAGMPPQPGASTGPKSNGSNSPAFGGNGSQAPAVPAG